MTEEETQNVLDRLDAIETRLLALEMALGPIGPVNQPGHGYISGLYTMSDTSDFCYSDMKLI